MLTTVENASRLGPALGHFAATLGTGHTNLHQQRFCIMALWEPGTGLKLTEAAFTDDHVLAAQFTLFAAQLQRGRILRNHPVRFFQQLFKGFIKIGQGFFLFNLMGRNGIQFVFHASGIRNVNDIAEMTCQHIRHFDSQIRSHQFFAIPRHVAPGLDRLDNRRIGRRTADALFFHLLDQRSFCIMGRSFGKMLFAGQYLI